MLNTVRGAFYKLRKARKNGENSADITEAEAMAVDEYAGATEKETKAENFAVVAFCSAV